jgi:hypothetical protein
MDDKWRTVKCGSCNGGMIWNWTEDGPTECNDCGGGGFSWIRPSGHLFQYPGGPGAGMWDKEAYEHGTPMMPMEYHDLKNLSDDYPIDDMGNVLPSLAVECKCGWEGTYAEYDIHYQNEEMKFRLEHNPNYQPFFYTTTVPTANIVYPRPL